MRIISNFKDYYDGVQRTAMDPTLIYKRNQVFHEEDRGYFRLNRHWSDETEVFKIGFCGKFYFIGRIPNSKDWLYGEELAAGINNPFDKYYDDGGASGVIRAGHGKEDHTLFLKYDCPLFVYGKLDKKPPSWRDTPRGIFANCNLETYGFFKIFDAFTAYQMIAQYISNNLARQEDPPPLSDKLKVQAHGFDKWSFRKDTPPTRKNKK